MKCKTPNCDNHVNRYRSAKMLYCEDCAYEMMGGAIEETPISLKAAPDMIYTVGFTSTYEEHFRVQQKPQKGIGGSVWRTYEEVKIYLGRSHRDAYRVYGVLANWEKDTVPNKDGEEWHDLLVNADLVKLE